jgi:hypothetical protein
MTATLDGVTNKRKDKPEPTTEQKVAEELVARAREQGLSLTGPDGLLKQLTKTVLETALNQELTEHLGHHKHGPVVSDSGNVRNGTRPQDGADREHWPGRHRGSAGPGGHVRAADRPQAAAAAEQGR